MSSSQPPVAARRAHRADARTRSALEAGSSLSPPAGTGSRRGQHVHEAHGDGRAMRRRIVADARRRRRRRGLTSETARRTRSSLQRAVERQALDSTERCRARASARAPTRSDGGIHRTTVIGAAAARDRQRRPREQAEPRARGPEQRDLDGQVEDPRDDDAFGSRRGPPPPGARAASAPAEPAVALRAQRPGADHDRVHARAQRVEDLAVGDPRSHRRRAPGDARPPVDGRDDAPTTCGPAPRLVRGRRPAARPIPRGRSSAVAATRSEDSSRRSVAGLVASRRHAGWPGSMSFTSWKYNSSPGS